jgi:hypothetical protein
MSNDDLYEDEVMRDVWARKAQLIEDYGGVDGYYKHLLEDPPTLRSDGTPWPEVNLGGVALARPLHHA